MRRLLFSVLFTTAFTCASAYDFSYSHHFFVDDTVKVENTLYYAVNEDGKTATVVAGPERYNYTRVEIPETVENEGKTYTVTAIGFESFRNGKVGILSMPNTVTDILVSAFLECDIDSVAFSTGLKTIGDNAFYRSSLTSVYLHEGLTTIGDYAFDGDYNTGKIRVVVLPESLTDLGKNAFNVQTSLFSVKLPSGLKEIKSGTFYYCAKLKTIELPNGLEKIGDSAFDSSGITEIDFPSSLKEIGEAAFYGANLIHLTLPNNVETIGGLNNRYGVFEYNYNLESCTLSSGLKTIPENAFKGCYKLVDVTIPEGITKIDKDAFQDCI